MAINLNRANIGFSGAIASIILTLFATFSYGQIRIIADTITFDCKEVYRTNRDVFILTSREDFDELSVFRDNPGCLPFEGVDFEKTAVVGFKYRGSNCERMIGWSAIVKHGGEYLIQFATSPNHVCRDLQRRIAWFIIDKPPGKIEVRFERTFRRRDIN